MMSSSKHVENKNNSEFCFLLSSKKKWQVCLRTHTNAANHHKSLQLVQFYRNLPPHNAVNQVLSLWKQLTDNREKQTVC
jgi:hypothetical protein